MSLALRKSLERVGESILGSSQIRKAYSKIDHSVLGSGSFLRAFQDIFEVTPQIAQGSSESIPHDGPVVVVANHPYGGMEAFALLKLISERRSDVRMLANKILKVFPLLDKHCFFVDAFESPDARRANYQPMKQMLSWLKKGKCIGVFPSGTVSHFHPGKLSIEDPDWHSNIGRLVHAAKATVVPVYFEGRNGLLFQIAGLIHPKLRTFLLPRMLLRRAGKRLYLRIGRPLPYEKLRHLKDPEQLTRFLRLRTYVLGSVLSNHEKVVAQEPVLSGFRPVIESVPAKWLDSELSRLPANQMLFRNAEYSVGYFSAGQAPNALREIGRLRELTFRANHEGTGNDLDLDRFDNFYTHLFLWNHKERELVGSYRLGHTDRILSRYGKRGLYTHTLFSYRSSLIREMGPALELGRSFIRQDYQKDYAPLLLLWKGIGAFVAENPRYKILFGPVSISQEYDERARRLIVAYLKANNLCHNLAKYVKARTPFRTTFRDRILDECGSSLRSMVEASDMLFEFSNGQAGMPVLLRQYLKLNAKILGFNLDSSFSNVLDALIYVDLTKTPKNVLVRYMGKQEAEAFTEYHRNTGLFAEDRKRRTIATR